MHQVVARLDALDPEAGAAVRVIRRFDELLEGRAGLEPILAAVAVLTGSPARLVDARFAIDLRADVGGQVRRNTGPADPRWPHGPLEPGGRPAFWLERLGGHTLVDAMVLDRAAFAAREVLHRTRSSTRTGPGSPANDPAAVEVLLDGGADEADRLFAARLLHLPEQADVRAVATADGARQIVVGRTLADRWDGAGRIGVGPAVPVLDLPKSWSQARTALRFAAAGTDDDPGPSVVFADELGSLMLLADALDPAGPPADVRALEKAARSGPWVLRTLVEFTSHASLRLAAAALYLHHSTLKDRITAIEHDLGFTVGDPPGRLRAQLALALRRLLLHPAAAD
ncbi:helix-turn-helix domain-containing protein [Amycolatopsis saalfeldensis]|uniref:PucR C-terminal helix-turn-helix domain-containing protein n=1 Tax=Amycolatopsis saalfeldensis TaxID=394193 RepID=A0A1H8Y4W3_9PSEU|nr:helix-turn-helix domain-containing protein [Amycolatopsis saalfeldensis]SEP47294.1 PucR C-terminal helix-turn-helix domain-containing protein [Amycolatopsis saalfeldensis]